MGLFIVTVNLSNTMVLFITDPMCTLLRIQLLYPTYLYPLLHYLPPVSHVLVPPSTLLRYINTYSQVNYPYVRGLLIQEAKLSLCKRLTYP